MRDPTKRRSRGEMEGGMDGWMDGERRNSDEGRSVRGRKKCWRLACVRVLDYTYYHLSTDYTHTLLSTITCLLITHTHTSEHTHKTADYTHTHF